MTQRAVTAAVESQASSLPPATALLRLLWPGPLAARAIYVAAKLGLADLIGTESKTIGELARATGTDESALGRLLHALACVDVFVSEGDDRIRQSPLSALLCTDHPKSLRRRVLLLNADFVWRSCGELERSIDTGQPAFEHVFGMPFFEYLQQDIDAAAVFDAGARTDPSYVATLVNAYDFSRLERIVDVGGGHGALMAGILAANPRVSGVVYDLPSVVAKTAVPVERSIGTRLERIGGDFFESVPPAGDAYMLCHVLHDWSDESAITILTHCRRAMKRDGRLIIFETIATPAAAAERAFMDIWMMVLTGGRQRTESDFRRLLDHVGFSLAHVIRTRKGAVLDARPRWEE